MSDLELIYVTVSRVWEDEVSKSFPFLGNIERVPERWDAIGIGYIQLVFTDPIGFEWMCKASSIEIVSIDVEVFADK